MQSIRSILGDLNDAQSDVEARMYANRIATRRTEDEKSIQEFLTCGHVDHAGVLQDALNEQA